MGDDYAAKYMTDGQVIAKSVKRMPWWWHVASLFFALLILGVTGATVLQKGPSGLVGLIPLPLIAFIWIAFSHLRVIVTRETVRIHLGWFGPTISVANIEAVGVDESTALAMSFGQKYLGKGTWAYGMGGRGVFIEYRDAAGKKKKALASSDDPEALVAAIERARAEHGVSAHVRVAEDEPRDAVALAVDEDEPIESGTEKTAQRR